MSLLWEDVWESLNGHFQAVADDLKTANPDLWWECGHFDSERAPFRSYASYSHRRPSAVEDDDVIVTLDFWQRDGRLEYTSDISQSDGQILADGPAGEIGLRTDTATIRSAVADVVTAVKAFLDKNLALLRERTAPGS